jgi:hypothetical protein
MRRPTLAMSVCLALLGCAVTQVDPLTVPLLYKANPKAPALSGTLACNSIGAIEVADGRATKVLGERLSESKPLKAEVSAAGDPVAWVKEGVSSYFSFSGVQAGGSGPELLITLDQLHTTESILRRASYDAKVALTGELKSSGKSCWRGTVQGAGSDYGYAGGIANYQIALDSALDAASQQLLAPQAFRDAMCHCGG